MIKRVSDRIDYHSRRLSDRLYYYKSIRLLRCCHQPPGVGSELGIKLFSIMKNERHRLPFFFKYYRTMGVKYFYIVVNDSSDGTADYLKQQPDVFLYTTNEEFRNADQGVRWIRILLNRHAIGSWCLFVDADEFFTFPFFEKISLESLCGFLDLQGYDTLHSNFVDFYPRDAIAKLTDTSDGNPFERCCYFDRICKLEGIRTSHGAIQQFYPDFQKTYDKVSLFRYNRGMHPTAGHHQLLRAKSAPISGVIVHAPYDHKFLEKCREAVISQQYMRGSERYRMYSELIEKNPTFSFHHSDSIQYRNSMQFVELKMARITDEYRTFVQSQEGCPASPSNCLNP